MADRGLDKVFYGLEEPALMFGGWCITDHFRLGSDSDGLNFDMGRLWWIFLLEKSNNFYL